MILHIQYKHRLIDRQVTPLLGSIHTFSQQRWRFNIYLIFHKLELFACGLFDPVIQRCVSAGQSACWKYEQKINLQIIKNTYDEFHLEKQDHSWKWCLDKGAVHVRKSPYISKKLGFFLRTVMNCEGGCLFPFFFIPSFLSFFLLLFSQFYIQQRI